MGGGICECSTRPGVRGSLSAQRDGVAADKRGDGDRAREVYRDGRRTGTRRQHWLGFDGRRVRYFRRSVESARGARRKSGKRFECAGANDWPHWIEGIDRGPVYRRAGARRQLRAAVRRGDFLEGRRGAWTLKPNARTRRRRFACFALTTCKRWRRLGSLLRKPPTGRKRATGKR